MENILVGNFNQRFFISNNFKSSIAEFNDSDFKENRKIIYLCNSFDKKVIDDLNFILKDIHKNTEFEVFSERDLLSLLLYEKRVVNRFELMYSSFSKNEKDTSSKISYFHENIQGLVCNVNANSYYTLYNQFKNFLFSNNVREYFKSKEDTEIVKTIKNDSQNFWFFNNGVTILCEDFEVNDSDKIILKNFSIINGAQTVSLIGKHYNSKDKPKMYVLTKIIKYGSNEYFNKNLSELFTEKIVQFTNNQKPIKSRDLKSNKLEMTKLQKELDEKYNIILNIKRGERYTTKPKPSNNNENYYWQYVSNEIYGQIFLAMLLQEPHKAIQLKTKIFSQNKIYDRIFKQEKFQINASKIIIYNYYQILNLIKDISKNYNNEVKEDIVKRLKMWIYAYITLLSIFSNNKYIDYSGQSFFNSWKENNFELQNEEIKEILNSLNAENNLKYFIQIFVDEVEKVWTEYKQDTRNKKSKNLLSFSYNQEQYLKLIENIFSKYFNESDLYNKNKVREIFFL